MMRAPEKGDTEDIDEKEGCYKIEESQRYYET